MGVSPSGKATDSDSVIREFESLHPSQKIDKFRLVDFLFKPQAWYGITRKRVWYRRRRMASPKVHFLRLDSIPSCNGFHTMLCIDSIHAFGVIVTHGFNSIRKLSEISFSSTPAKKSTSFLLVDFLFKPQAWYGITL